VKRRVGLGPDSLGSGQVYLTQPGFAIGQIHRRYHNEIRTVAWLYFWVDVFWNGYSSVVIRQLSFVSCHSSVDDYY
jgi:hypothetical protein